VRRTGRRARSRRVMKDALRRHLVSPPGSLSRHTLAYRRARQGRFSALCDLKRHFSAPTSAVSHKDAVSQGAVRLQLPTLNGQLACPVTMGLMMADC
jgi:hypothetical protein